MRHSITEKVTGWVDQAIVNHARGEHESVLWEPTLLPDPESRSAIYTIIIWLPSPIADEVICGSFQIPDPVNVTKAHIDGTLEAFLPRLFEGRSQMIAAAQQAAENDHQEPPVPSVAPVRGTQTQSGLYIP